MAIVGFHRGTKEVLDQHSVEVRTPRSVNCMIWPSAAEVRCGAADLWLYHVVSIPLDPNTV